MHTHAYLSLLLETISSGMGTVTTIRCICRDLERLWRNIRINRSLWKTREDLEGRSIVLPQANEIYSLTPGSEGPISPGRNPWFPRSTWVEVFQV